jgi:circadian clock protein KaiC
MAITPAGLEVFPRLEALHAGSRPTTSIARERRPFGVAGLDGMIGGGLLSGSTTLVLGPVGGGKTMAGLHFVVEGARRGEPGLIASFQEPPERLIAKAAGVGLDLGHHVAEGRVRVLWHPSLELLLDAWVQELLVAVAAQRPIRLVVDTITDAQLLAPDPARLAAFTAALVSALTAHGVTTIFNAELRTVVGGELTLPIPAVAGAIENVLLLRYLEVGARLHRLISVIKSGESGYDSGVREFTIGDRGMQVADSTESVQALFGQERSAERAEFRRMRPARRQRAVGTPSA